MSGSTALVLSNRSYPTPAVSSNFARNLFDWETLSSTSTMPTGGSISRAGNAMLYDSTGKLTYAPNNLYINSGSATNTARTITTQVGVNYYIWIQTSTGTATIVASGTNTSTFNGSTSGTYTAFTATAGTLTLTPTSNFANITQVVVAAVTYETALRSVDNVVTSGSAYYGPRFDYDPVTLQPKGLLVEGTRTNRQTYSNVFSSWALEGVSVSSSTITSPEGVGNAYEMNATTGNCRFINGLLGGGLSTNTTYTFSVYVKKSTSSTVQFERSYYSGTLTATTFRYNFDTDTITVVNGVGSIFRQILGNGWVRIGVTENSGNNTACNTYLYPGGVFGATGKTNFYGFQLEEGSFATSYINNPGASPATTTRAAETFSLTGYANRLLEAYYIDEETGANYSGNSALSTGTVTINPPTFGWVTSLRAYTNAYAGDITTPSWLSFSRTGNAMYYDSTGTLTWAPSNMLLNSATLSTQTVTVTSGATNLLSFSGTGSITYSGAASGTLTGTGANNRVSVVLTMSTTSLTLTVSGTVTNAQLERVTYQTQPSAYIPTTSAAVYGPRYDYDPRTYFGFTATIANATPNSTFVVPTTFGDGSAASGVENYYVGQTALINGVSYPVTAYAASSRTVTITGLPAPVSQSILLGNPEWQKPRGLLIEEQRANLATYSQQVGGTGWATSNATVSTNALTAPDGTNTASLVTATAGSYSTNVYQTPATVNGTTYTLSFFVKKNVGDNIRFDFCNVANGPVFTFSTTSFSVVAGFTTSVTSVGNGWFRIVITRANTTTASGPQITLQNSGDSVFVWGAQLEAGSFATSYIPSITGATRAPDVAQWTSAAQSSYFNAAAGTFGAQIIRSSSGGNNWVFNVPVNSGLNDLVFGNTNANYRYGGSNGIISTAYTTARAFVAYNASASGSSAISINNSNVVLSSATGAVTYSGSPVVLGNYLGTGYLNGHLQSFAYYNQRLPDAILKQKSTVNAPY